MLRQNLAMVLALSLAAAYAGDAFAKSVNGRRRLDEMKTTPDKWDELMNAEALPDDKPERPVYQAPATRPQRVPQAGAPQAAGFPQAVAPRAYPLNASTRIVNTTSRGPASLEPSATRIAPPVAVFPVASFTFDEYIADNARNPLLTSKIADHQKAFADTAGPAVITIPGSEPVATAASATSPGSGATAGSTNGASAAAIQAAAAAAGITLPAGATIPSAPAASGPVR